ncbi:hypothetical protein [Rhodococcoides fascians]|uniref:hypothetical protein n=1 Tax=Rhodococcoides fascians TaxID=1828 RepID=UPI00050C3CD9|nr:hypothetical protein [Rhodococcus fascians]
MRTPLQIADIIISDPRIDLSAMHTLIDSPTHDDTVSVSRSHSISAPSIELDGVTVHVSMLVMNPSYWGTFDRTAGTRMVRIIIHARSTTDAEHDSPPPPVRLPLREQIGWVRAALGQAFDHAYRVMNERTLLRIRGAFFVVFLDGTRGRLAPSDLDWAQVCGGRRAYAEKLVPDDRALLNRMVRDGDVLDASLTTHPHAPQPLAAWAHEFLSHIAATIADYLGRIGDGRWFTFEEVRLDGTSRLVIRYTQHLTDGDRRYGFDIDVAGLRAQQLHVFDDPRASTAGRMIGATPFGHKFFRDTTIIDDVTWAHFGSTQYDSDATDIL